MNVTNILKAVPSTNFQSVNIALYYFN